jgi:hypothetical protein
VPARARPCPPATPTPAVFLARGRVTFDPRVPCDSRAAHSLSGGAAGSSGAGPRPESPPSCSARVPGWGGHRGSDRSRARIRLLRRRRAGSGSPVGPRSGQRRGTTGFGPRLVLARMSAAVGGLQCSPDDIPRQRRWRPFPGRGDRGCPVPGRGDRPRRSTTGFVRAGHRSIVRLPGGYIGVRCPTSLLGGVDGHLRTPCREAIGPVAGWRTLPARTIGWTDSPVRPSLRIPGVEEGRSHPGPLPSAGGNSGQTTPVLIALRCFT